MNPHRAPILDKSLMLLNELAGQGNGLSMADLASRLRVPRSSVYRILNSLLAYRFVQKSDNSPLYRLGTRIEELAQLAAPDNMRARLVARAGPGMARLVATLGEACKLSVRDDDQVETIHALLSPADYGLTIKVGRRGPIHTGGSGKALLAFLPEAERERLIAGPLAAFTPYTITDPELLRETLAEIRRQGFAEDNAELRAGIRSVAAPIFSDAETPVAALSVPFLGEPTPDRVHLIRREVLETARSISADLAGYL
ncbi:MAG: IclR family transcriptional regulator [Telmatospirillum sp.]|nr:IclR family transcriptional regulator [Telmatospirillum sp.]